MRDVLQYFDWITKLLEHSPDINAEIELDQLDQKRGTINGTIYLADGSRLEFTERISIERARPVKRAYRYQFVRAQIPVFRYDNAPHHPELPGFPHHKHIGRKTLPAIEPTLQQVLQEIGTTMPTAPATGTPTRKSRPKAERK